MHMSQRPIPRWQKILLALLGALLLGELVMILWASWVILTFE
jgi:hypothetical protein